MRETFSAGGIVLGPDGRVLVVNQRGRTWSLPKGHIDPGEKPLEAAQREIAEESGVTELQYLESLGSYARHRIGLMGEDDIAERKTIYMFLFRTRQEQLAPRDPMNPEARWIVPGEVSSLLSHRKDREFFEAQMPRIRAALAG